MRSVISLPSTASLAFLASLAIIPCCSSSNAAQCALPSGQECCDGDEIFPFTCDANGNVVCSNGFAPVPVSDCSYPFRPADAGTAPSTDARTGADANACAPADGFECCDGDVLGTWTCGSDGGTVCSAGTRLTPVSQCTIAPPFDAGNDASTSDASTDAATDGSTDAADEAEPGDAAHD